MSHRQELNKTGIRIFPKWLTLIDFEMALAYNLIISRCQDFYLATHNYHTYFKSLPCQKLKIQNYSRTSRDLWSDKIL